MPNQGSNELMEAQAGTGSNSGFPAFVFIPILLTEDTARQFTVSTQQSTHNLYRLGGGKQDRCQVDQVFAQM
jgi:hypothetical protein